MILLGSLILVTYVLILAYLLIGFYKVRDLKPNQNKSKPNHRFSILVPFRNEAENLPLLINSLEELDYPNSDFEIILINDDSTDESVFILENLIHKSSLSYTLLNNQRFSASPKKDAITLAIEHAAYSWIITTDADCKVPKKWLTNFNQFILNNNSYMIIAPVSYMGTKGLINQFQRIENFSLQTTTIGGFGHQLALLCNGANLAYKKGIFKEVNGYHSNHTIASGDDVFLLESIKKKYPNNIGYLKNKDVLVQTKSQETWKAIIEQRIRWASKNKQQKDGYLLSLGATILCTNLFLIIAIGMSFILPKYLTYSLSFIGIKFGIDFLYCKTAARFFKEEIPFSPFIINWFLYPFISMFIFIKSLKGRYHWKGRAFN